MTPKYGQNKYNLYRIPVINMISDSYKGLQPSLIVSLGGAYCLENELSIENQLLKQYKNCKLFIIENNLKSFKHLRKTNRYSERVSIINTTLLNFLKFINRNDKTIDIIIADFYCGFNKQVLKTVNYIIRKDIVNSKSHLFLTSSECYRASTQPIVRKIKSFSRTKNYKAGIISLIKQISKNTTNKVESINSWSYDNKDIISRANTMHVFNIKMIA